MPKPKPLGNFVPHEPMDNLPDLVGMIVMVKSRAARVKRWLTAEIEGVPHAVVKCDDNGEEFTVPIDTRGQYIWKVPNAPN